jgi:hypothetical protein|tara:strand:+ start:692 stop:1156 length:465 start_codon:yes stop_codon:yes gene_type:complete
MKDLSNNVVIASSLINAVKTAAANGTGVDLQGYESALAVVAVGAEGDTLAANLNFQISLQHSDDNSTFTDCVQAEIVDGTIAADGNWLILDGTTSGDPGTAGGVWQVSYVGGKRYVRLVIDKTGTHSTGTSISGLIVKGAARHSSDNANTIHNV